MPKLTADQSEQSDLAAAGVKPSDVDRHLSTLDSLLKDANGNLSIGDFGNAAGYLHSISDLASALSRQCQQEHELSLLEEVEVLEASDDLAQALAVKRRLNQRELELCKLEATLADYAAMVSAHCFRGASDAANALRSIADTVEAQADTALFPRPITEDDLRSWAAERGISFKVEDDPVTTGPNDMASTISAPSEAAEAK